MDSEKDLINEEIAKLTKENKLLRKLLGISENEKISILNPEKLLTNKSPTHDKINIYRSLFKGREDLFAQRWENRDKSGYSPVCLNRWDKTKCHLPKIKCNGCHNRELKAIDSNVIYDHLAGKITIGIYPILSNDNCNFLAIDFDKKNWKEDLLAIYSTCIKLEIPASIEISRSGNGAHQQYVGRIVRSHEAKNSIEVYDYVDINQERFIKMYDKRRKAYKRLGFEIENCK